MPGESPMTLQVVQHRFGLCNWACSRSLGRPWPGNQRSEGEKQQPADFKVLNQEFLEQGFLAYKQKG
jgi:hypothetical protein